MQTHTNNVNKTRDILQTTGGKDEPNIVLMRKSSRTSQHGTPNVKTHNMTHSQIHINEKNNVKIVKKTTSTESISTYMYMYK
jgi:hypothetical protein